MIAICVGHSRPGDRGAVSVGGITEWEYNRLLAALMISRLRELDMPAMIVERYEGITYGRAMRALGQYLRAHQVTLAVELHFNSFDDPESNGHEWLYWHNSGDGLRLATALERSTNRMFPGNKRRGLIPVTSRKTDGAGFLMETSCPAVVCEPFFGTNPREWKLMAEKQCILADGLVAGLERYTLNHSAS